MSVRNRRRGGMSPSATGVLGLLAMAAVAFVVFVSYGANDGVPGRSYRSVVVEVPDVNRLVPNNQVRMAGVRIGQVLEITAVPRRGDVPSHGRLEVQLEPNAPGIPVDTVATVRPASVLGATYLDLQFGRSRQLLADAGRLPLLQARRNVELTDLMDVFDAPTSRAIQQGVSELGGGLVGRGTSFNAAISDTSDLLAPFTRLMGTIADPATKVTSLIGNYDAVALQVAAQSSALGRLLADGATTMRAVSAAETNLTRALQVFPAAASETGRAFVALRPGLDGLARISRTLRPAADRLPAAASNTVNLLNGAHPWLRVTPALAGRLETTGDTLKTFAELPQTEGAIRRAGDMLVATGELLEELTPAQTVCNYVTLFGEAWRNVFGRIGVGDGPPVGNAHLAKLGVSPLEVIQNATPLPGLHTNYTPNANENECEAGNEEWLPNRNVFTNPPGNQRVETYKTTIKPRVLERARKAGLLEAPPAATTR